MDRSVAAVLTITLDTSAALNFLGVDDDASDELARLIGRAMTHSVGIAVADEARVEVEGVADQQRRVHRLARLRSFGFIETPASMLDQREELVVALRATLFPGADLDSRTGRHNTRDCRHLATHMLAGRDLFVTTDEKLWKRRATALDHGITVMRPSEALERVSSATTIRLVATVDAVNVRDADLPDDEPSIRAVLAPLSADYPGFDGWLISALNKVRDGTAAARVAVLDGRVGAVALTTRKDDRTVKLSAFFVDPAARDLGLGAHLLWDEIRRWVALGYDKAYVTVSSRHSELVDFFGELGFLVEGVSARRYQDDTAEIVLAKHLVRRVIADGDAATEVVSLARMIYTPSTHLDSSSAHWALRPDAASDEVACATSGENVELRVGAGDQTRTWNAGDLERTFHPMRFDLTGRTALVVPIQPGWANEMISYPKPQAPLFGPDTDKLLMRTDNVYYGFPKCLDHLDRGTPILFYVTEGTGFVGEARLRDHSVDLPEELFARFGPRGAYELSDIRGHVQPSGQNAGRALALLFASYVPFLSAVTRDEACEVVRRNLLPQGLTPISGQEFEHLRRKGGLTW